MNNFKRVIAVLLACAMIIPMGIFVTAETPELTNWNTMAGKYSASTHAIIAPKSNDYKFIEPEPDPISEVNADELKGQISIDDIEAIIGFGRKTNLRF